MAKFVEPVKGSRDFYPTQRALQNFLFEKAKKVSFKFGYQEFEGPLLEPLELYQAKSGSELVEKQAYVFTDRGGRKVAIRPELTPTLARMIAVDYHNLPKPIRWFEIGQFWRYESPKKDAFANFISGMLIFADQSRLFLMLK
jgi:histidyl-tRNA synthetase